MASSVPTGIDPVDLGHMRVALALARRGLGQVAPNPAVGCIVARGRRILARGWTQPGGRPHAETEALARAGSDAKGASAYVTLEPCAHHGETPPCDQALIAAGVSRCVVAMADPDTRVSGQGLAHLRAAGIAVTLGVCEAEAAEVNAGYLLNRTQGRPLVTLKLATTLDGRIATKSGESRWITGEAARARAHLLRARHDAVLVGSKTARLDNPRLDVRLPGLAAASPIRVVLDAGLSLPPGHDLVTRAAAQPTWIISAEGHAKGRSGRYRDAGVALLTVGRDLQGRLSLSQALGLLAERGITRLLVEGGGELAASLLQADLVDRLYWFRAPRVIGAEGIPAIGELALDRLPEAPRFERTRIVDLGADVLETYRRCA